MAELSLEWQIKNLHLALCTLRLLNNDGVELTTAIEQADSKFHELCKQAGWYSVSPIRNGSATESIFFGTHEECQKFVSEWLKYYQEDKGHLIISPL